MTKPFVTRAFVPRSMPMFNLRVYKRSYRVQLNPNAYHAMISDLANSALNNSNGMDSISIVISDEDYGFRPIFHQCFRMDFCIRDIIPLIEQEIGTTWYGPSEIYKELTCEIAIKENKVC